jgi:hypothetical protein
MPYQLFDHGPKHEQMLSWFAIRREEGQRGSCIGVAEHRLGDRLSRQMRIGLPQWLRDRSRELGLYPLELDGGFPGRMGCRPILLPTASGYGAHDVSTTSRSPSSATRTMRTAPGWFRPTYACAAHKAANGSGIGTSSVRSTLTGRQLKPVTPSTVLPSS